MEIIEWPDFERVELRVGTIIKVEDFPEAKKPSYKLWIDFGEELGVRKSSAQIVAHYTKESLMGKQVMGVVNFRTKQIGPIKSEVLITGFPDENNDVVLAVPDKKVPNGKKLF